MARSLREDLLQPRKRALKVAVVGPEVQRVCRVL